MTLARNCFCVLVATAAAAHALVTVTTPNYAAPGYIIAGDATRRSVRSRAQFSYTSPAAGNRTLRATFQLVDDSAVPAPVGIYLDGDTAKANDTVSVDLTQAFAKSTPTGVTIDADIVPYDRLDPSRVYKFKVLSVWDVTDLIDTNLNETGTQATGNGYIHFPTTAAASLRVSALMQTGTYSQSFRVSSAAAAAPESSFKVTPSVKLYRYDPGATNATVNLQLSVILRDDLNAVIPLDTSTFDRSVASMPPKNPVVDIPYVTAALPLDDLEIRPTGQLDAVNRTYTATVTVAFMDVPGSNTYIGVYNGVSTGAATMLDFNGELRFNTIQTTFTDISNTPSAGGISGSRRATTLTLAAGTGRIVGQGDAYTFGGGPLNVALASNGIAYLLGGSPTVNVSGPASDADTLKGIGFERGNLQLSTSGLAAGTMSVTLPPGVGYTTNANTMRFGSTLSTTNVGLTQALDPSGVVSLPGGRLTEESKPVEYAVSGIDWTGSTGQMAAAVTGVTPVRLAEVTALEADSVKLINPSAAKKAANDHLYLGANNVSGGTLTIARDGNGNGTVTSRLTLGGYKFHPHLPYADPADLNQDINYGGGTITVAADKVVPADSSITGVNFFRVPFNRACTDREGVTPVCGSPPDTGLIQFVPNGFSLRVTRDGGLQANGVTSEFVAAPVALQLKWGQNPEDPAKYAHTITTSFNQGAYLMAGSSLPGGVAATGSTAPEASTGAWLGAGAILYSGVDRAGVADDNVARPGTAAYVESDAHIADYPGLNFRATDFGTANASSILAGGAPAAYSLTSRSQYYTRNAGVSGIHEAADFDRLLQLYGAAPVGYPVKFTTFKFSYLDNFNEDSRTHGSITLPPPSDFTVDFSRLTLTCPGGLNDAQVDSSVPLLLKYWGDAPITPLSLRFHTADGCSPAGPAVLVMGVQAECELFDKLLSGELGFRGSGQIAARADPQVAAHGVPPFDSRLKVPSVGLPGPASKTYTFTPSQDAYFNAADAAGAPGTGYLNLAGTVDVPFFEDLKWHVQAGADYTEGLVPGLYEVAGGWESAGDTFFNNIFFDAENKGFGGASAEAYRQSSRDGGTYAVTARQDWLGITDAFHYDLQWNQGGRAFSSDDVTKDFFVVSLSHRAKYLCPDTAELTFGLSYDGLPQVNLSGLADSALDAGVGYTQNLIDAMGDAAAGTLLGGLDAGKTLLSNEIEDLMAPVIDGPVMSAVDDLLDDLYGAAPGTPAVEIPVANATAAVNTAIRVSAAGTVRQAIDTAFTTVGDVNGTGTAVGVVNSSLTDIRGGVEKLTASNGLFQTAGIKKLVSSLVAREAPQFVSLVAGELAGAALDDVVNTPALDEIRGSLGGVNTLLSEISDKVVNPTTGLKAQLAVAMSAEIATLSDSIADAVDEELARFASGGNIDMAEVPRAELRARIRSIIADRLVSSQTAGVLQTQVRQYVQDAVTACTTQIDSGMQQVNGTLRDVIATRLAEVDQSINGSILGPMSDMLGTGRLSGYAHITGDSLTMLRVDGRFRFKVPDNLDLSAYLQIKQLTSDNAGGCVPAGQTANEVLIGAERVPLEWISPNLKANVGVKFTLMDGDPIGLGGFFDMTGGPLTFEAFSINDMNAALAFGAIDGDPWAAENYLAASTDLQIGDWGMAGGVFFGRSCSLDPIALIDPEVAGVLGNPPFTGAYLYGEARAPLNELLGIPSSCMLKLVYGAGTGVFYFHEGPTFGGKLVGEISGEALCLVSISGRMSLVGAKQGLDLTGPMRFAGKGTLKGKAGACPFCVRFKKSVGIKFNVSGGDISSPDISY